MLEHDSIYTIIISSYTGKVEEAQILLTLTCYATRADTEISGLKLNLKKCAVLGTVN